jgi:hypothetical protein
MSKSYSFLLFNDHVEKLLISASEPALHGGGAPGEK